MADLRLTPAAAGRSLGKTNPEVIRMRCFYAPETSRHDPQFRLTNGRVQANAERAERAQLLLEGLNIAGLSTEEPPLQDRSAYETVHTPRFLDFLATAWDRWQDLPNAADEVIPNTFPRLKTQTYPQSVVGQAGWHAGDVSAPIGPGSWEATQRAADSALAAADAVLAGEHSAYALCRPPGHHTSAEVAAGHCLMNVSAIAAVRLLAGHDRVAILDIDTHHGNGTQDIFYDRGDVFFASVHTDTADYYPFFTGTAEETGHGVGAGATLNIPVARTTGDDDWCDAIHQALDRIVDFAPGALVLSLGLDAHKDDPLKGMSVGDEGFTRAARRIRAAGYPTVLVQEGGYMSPSSDDGTCRLSEGLARLGGRCDPGVPAPDREVQRTGDADPDEVGHEKKARDPVDLPERDHAGRDRDPERREHDHAATDPLQPEKHRRPERVERDLKRPERHRDGVVIGECNPRASGRHTYVKRRPGHRKQPVRRRPRGLGELAIPFAGRKDRAGRTGGKTGREKDGECDPDHRS